MLRSSNNHFGHHQPPSSVYNYKTLNESVMTPTSTGSTPRKTSIASSRDGESSNRTVRKLLNDQPLHPPPFRQSSNISLKSMLIEGRWEFRGSDDDRLRFKSMGIENLVDICNDIMHTTRQDITHKRHQQHRRKSSATSSVWPVVRLDGYRQLTNADRSSLNRAHLFDLMTIVYEAASTSASISQLVRIWREVSEHVHRRPRTSSSRRQPQISYEIAFRHLLRTPDNSLLQMAVHASLLSGHSRADLRRLGEKFGINQSRFDMGSIKDSSEAFQNFLQILREQVTKREREQQHVNTNKLPYKPRKKRGLNANVSGTKFGVVRKAADVFGFSISTDADFTCNLLWNDTLISMDIVSALKPYQKINHFPTMSEISRKDLLAKNFDKLSRVLPDEFNFTPRTWLLPNEYQLWYSYASTRGKQSPSAYILKPNNGAMGHGIQVHCDIERIQPLENYIIQEYIQEPFLLDGYKFDLRIYALLTSCDPLRVFIFDNGLVRMSTEKYEIPSRKNASHLYMHLTNYSVNKYNVDYELSGSNTNSGKTGSKRSLKYLFEYLRAQNKDATALWKDIQNIVRKTVFLAQPHLFTAYRMCRPAASPSSESVCFELLGFDILLDKNLKPWVIEVNRCPSFGTNEQIDFDIKVKLLLDTFALLRFKTSDRKNSVAIEKAEAQRRLYSNLGKPTRLFDDTSTMFSNGDRQDFRTRQRKLTDVKDKLYLIRRERAREDFENRHLGGFRRLFPVDDSILMNELMPLLAKCFEILYTNKKDTSWSSKYYDRYKEDELLGQLEELEDLDQVDRSKNSRLARSAPSSKSSFSSWSIVSLTEASNHVLVPERASPTASFASDCSDEDEETQISPPSDLTSKETSSMTTITTRSSLHTTTIVTNTTSHFPTKRVATQTGSNLIRSTSLSPLILRKQQRQTPFTSTGIVSRPTPQSRGRPPGIAASRITEKKAYAKPPTSYTDRQQSQMIHKKINPPTNDKSQMVTYTSIVQAARKQQQINVAPLTNRSSTTTISQELQLTDNDLSHLYQMTLKQMRQLSIRYPNKSDEETSRVCAEIIENWDEYKTELGEFWLVRLDARKRQAIVRIVWTNVQRIMKQLWAVDELVEKLPLSRHLSKLQERLLANNGQCLWETCQNKHSSWEAPLIRSTHRVSAPELACCHRFVELCQQALFIVYRYSLDEKLKKQQQLQQQQQQQQQQQHEGTSVMVAS